MVYWHLGYTTDSTALPRGTRQISSWFHMLLFSWCIDISAYHFQEDLGKTKTLFFNPLQWRRAMTKQLGQMVTKGTINGIQKPCKQSEIVTCEKFCCGFPQNILQWQDLHSWFHRYPRNSYTWPAQFYPWPTSAWPKLHGYIVERGRHTILARLNEIHWKKELLRDVRYNTNLHHRWF